MSGKKSTLKPSLPQHDSAPQQRADDLARLRNQYNWDYDYAPPLALLYEAGTASPNLAQAVLGWELGEIPDEQEPSAPYVAGRAEKMLGLAKNDAARLLGGGVESIRSLDDYKRLFVTLPLPRTADTWWSDAEIGWQRIAGANPVLLRRVVLSELQDRFALTEDVAASLPDGLTLEGLSEAGRLFLCDYSVLEGLTMAAEGNGYRVLVPCLGLFYVDPSIPDAAQPLRPLAIQLSLDPDPARVYTPKDGGAWTVAKLCLQVADVNVHEIGTHLTRTHFIEEGVAVAAFRTLSRHHPLMLLLWPVLRDLIFNNFEGRELLVNPDGFVPHLMAGGRDGSMQLLARSAGGYPARGVPGFNFQDLDFPAWNTARGVDAIPSYPYRDDGKLLWDAIQHFAGDYVGLYYASPDDVLTDSELQAWVAELGGEDGARLQGVTPVRTREDLTLLLTKVMFLAGPQHSAVNYPQYEFIAFAPNMPGALYARVPDELRGMDQEAIDAWLLSALPTADKASLQLTTVYQLTSYHADQLGRYQEGDFADPGALKLVEAFQASLDEVEREIERRNAERYAPYDYLRPSQVLNATSI